MANFPIVHAEKMTGYAENPSVYSSMGKMAEPTGSPHVRAIEFRLPRFKTAPTVSMQITAPHGSSMMAVSSVKVNDNVSGQTQVAIQAQTIRGGPAQGEHYCTITVSGTPLE
jgi:hypothetical protein